MKFQFRRVRRPRRTAKVNAKFTMQNYSLPLEGKGDRIAVDEVLSSICCITVRRGKCKIQNAKCKIRASFVKGGGCRRQTEGFFGSIVIDPYNKKIPFKNKRYSPRARCTLCKCKIKNCSLLQWEKVSTKLTDEVFLSICCIRNSICVTHSICYFVTRYVCFANEKKIPFIKKGNFCYFKSIVLLPMVNPVIFSSWATTVTDSYFSPKIGSFSPFAT